MLKLFNKLILLGSVVLLSACASNKFSTGDPAPVTKEKPVIVTDYSEYASIGLMNVDASYRNDFSLAASAMKNKKSKKAAELLDSLIRQRPDLVTPIYNRAYLAQSSGDSDSALSFYQQAHFIDPANTSVCTAYARELRSHGKFKDAEEVYLVCLGFEEQSPIVHKNYGILLDLYLLTPKLALQQYKKYLALKDNSDRTVKGWIIDLERRLKAKGAL